MPGVTPPGSWGVSESLSLDCPCCPELVFANLSYYLVLSSSSQAWPVPVAQLWWQCLGEDQCWQPGKELDGTVALEPAVLVALAVCQAGAHTGQLPLCLAETRLLILGLGCSLWCPCSPGCSAPFSLLCFG